MIRSDHDIQHGLAHLGIGESAVVVTMAENRFSAEALQKFFSELRAGHAAALSQHSDQLASVIQLNEHSELDQYGIFGQFAGRMAIKETGLTIVEQILHHDDSIELKEKLSVSLRNAAELLQG